MNGRRRTFSELRQAVLITLLSGQKTTNEISTGTGINWRTAEAHLAFLIAKGFVAEVLRLEYVRIFRLTPVGEEHARFLLQTNSSVSSSQPHDVFKKKVNKKTQLLSQPKRKEYGEKTKMEVMLP